MSVYGVWLLVVGVSHLFPLSPGVRATTGHRVGGTPTHPPPGQLLLSPVLFLYAKVEAQAKKPAKFIYIVIIK